MAYNLLKSQAFKLKGRLYTLTVIHLLQDDPELFYQHLADTTAKAPKLFDRTPVVIDCSSMDGAKINLSLFCGMMREQNLIPIAIQGGNAAFYDQAQREGLAILNTNSTDEKPLSEKESLKDAPYSPEPPKTRIMTSPVRSGQQVVSKGGDLIITAAVSHGAELLADGNIHVYGVLRGRALAGIAGDKDARIFCQALEAELVSIAGYYRLSDSIERHTSPCQIYLKGEQIQIEPL